MAVFALLNGIIWLLDQPFKKKIKNSTSVEESLKYRKQLRIFRKVWSILLILITTIGLIAFDVSVDLDPKSMSRDIAMIIAFAIMTGYSKLTGNVQALSKDGYLEKYGDEGFDLYLRSFETDFYTKDPKRQKYTFEGNLVKTLKKYHHNVCAIGMTKELDAPYGAARVYVDDSTWQDDVKDLMEEAEKIYILMSDRESCIWEIVQSADKLQKTVFFIDSKEVYSNIRQKISSIIQFPMYEDIVSDNGDDKKDKYHMLCLYSDDSGFHAKEFDSLGALDDVI